MRLRAGPMKYLIEQTLPIQEITNALAFSPDGAQLALSLIHI